MDIRHGRLTLPLIIGLERDSGLREALEAIRTGRLEVDALGRRIDAVHEQLAALGAFEAASERARALVERAVAALEPLAASVYRDTLRRLAHTVLEALPQPATSR